MTTRTTTTPAALSIFVFGYDRYETMSTSTLLEMESIPHLVLCHDEAAKQRFVDGGSALPHRLHATGQPKGLANNRNAALDMMKPGEWALFLVDDLKNVTLVDNYEARTDGRLGITMQNQKTIAPTTRQPATMRSFIRAAHETISVCETMGAHLGGFCGISNPLFRDNKWRFNVLADGRAWVVKKGNLRFDTGAQLIDDLCWTAQNIEQHGVVVVNQWVLPDCRRYTAGAFGSIEERLPQKAQEAAYLVKQYPALIRHARKAGWPDGTHVQLKRTLQREHTRALEQMAITAGNGYRHQN
jgi:hypothetical protein